MITWDILDIAVGCSIFETAFLNSFFSWIWKCNNLMEIYCFLIYIYKKKKGWKEFNFFWFWCRQAGSKYQEEGPLGVAKRVLGFVQDRNQPHTRGSENRVNWIAWVTECNRQSYWKTWKEKDKESHFCLGFILRGLYWKRDPR